MPSPSDVPRSSGDGFDPEAKEAALRAEATSWDTSEPADAEPGDIPVVDVGDYFATGSTESLALAAVALNDASENVGFHQLVGHGISTAAISDIFVQARRFHDLPLEVKQRINIDNPDWLLPGAGYLPIGERRLPRRAKGNLNEAFLIKGDRGVGFDDNQWLDEDTLPGFRTAVESFADQVTGLARRLLPVYAAALDLDPAFFAPAFTDPFWRLRMTHYPPDLERDADEFGIAPHVDTTFFTLLLQDSPGLTIFSEERGAWMNVPMLPDAFVVNSGELLRQWSNDRYLSTRHFANNNRSGQSRYSIPLFFNATADFPMTCLPSCTDADNPPKYPPISYLESQGVVQGE